MRTDGINLREISKEILKIIIHEISLKITHLRSQPPLRGANELNSHIGDNQDIFPTVKSLI